MGCARIHDYSATIDSRSGQVYLKIVNPGSRDMPAQLSFGGRNGGVFTYLVPANSLTVVRVAR